MHFIPSSEDITVWQFLDLKSYDLTEWSQNLLFKSL